MNDSKVIVTSRRQPAALIVNPGSIPGLNPFHKIVVSEPREVTGGEILRRKARQKRRSKNFIAVQESRDVFCNIAAIFYINRKLE